MFSALWAGLTACGASTSTSTHIGGPCDPSNTCDDGQICDRTAPSGQKCIAASGDACDACPIAAPGGTDADGDAVSAPCDPDTRTPGDRILLFNGFNAAVS